MSRFKALQDEARGYGVESVVALMQSDPLDKTEVKTVTWKGGPVSALGMIEFAKFRLMEDMTENRGTF